MLCIVKLVKVNLARVTKNELIGNATNNLRKCNQLIQDGILDTICGPVTRSGVFGKERWHQCDGMLATYLQSQLTNLKTVDYWPQRPIAAHNGSFVSEVMAKD